MMLLSLITVADGLWQEVVAFFVAMGGISVFTGRKAIIGFVIDTIQKVQNSKNAEVKQAELETKKAYAFIIEGMVEQREEKIADYQQYLEKFGENLSPAEKEVLVAKIEKAQVWVSNATNKYLPQLHEQIQNCMKDLQKFLGLDKK